MKGSMRRNRRHAKGFTLIELLITVVVVGLIVLALGTAVVVGVLYATGVMSCEGSASDTPAAVTAPAD